MRSDFVRGGWYRAAVLAALFVLLSGCTRPQGTLALPSITPSPSPVAGHGPLTITDVAMHSGEVGLAFAPITLAATGGVAPYHWTVSVGALPAGLALSPDGVISGTPGSNGFFQFGIQVFDADGDTAGLPRTIGIVSRLTAALVPACATECAVELGCVTVCGTFGQVSGGASPLTFKLTSGALPSGTSLSGMALNGTFTGLPGRLSFTVQVTDGFGLTASLTPTFNLFPHISLSSGSCRSSFYKTTPCSTSLTFSGGTPGQEPTVKVVSASGQFCPQGPTGGFVCAASSSPPPNFTATVGGGAVNALVPASPNYPFTYQGTVTLRVTDQSLCASGSNCSAVGTVMITIQAG